MTTTISIGGSHAIVNLEKMASGYHGNLESVQHTADLDNGSLINLGALVSGERELTQVAVPATATLATAEVLLVASPEITYYAGQTLADFYNPANTPARAYHLHVGDVFTISASAVDGGAAVALNSYVTAQNGSTRPIATVAEPTLANFTFVGQIIDTPTLSPARTAAVTIKVIQA